MVRKQTIPVSTNPMGADVYANGQYVGVTPTTVELARNRDHILNLAKTGYRQEDVLVMRSHQTEKVVLNAVSQGLQTGKFFNDAAWGIQSGIASMNAQEQTGEAYVLEPSAVSVTLVPTAGATSRANVENVQEVGVVLLTADDRRELGHILESGSPGTTMSWTNHETKNAYFVTPEQTANSEPPVRYFTIVTRAGEQTETERFPAHRIGAEVWEIGLPPATAAASPESPSLGKMVQAAAIAAAVAGAQSVPVGKSSKTHTHTSTSADGNTTKTTRTSTSVSVGVNPVGLLQAVSVLFDEKQAAGMGQR